MPAPVKRSFECVVEGQYAAVGEVTGAPVVKFYKESFVLPSQEAALSKICKHLLAARLRIKYPDYLRYRTHKLVSITAIGKKPDTGVLQMSIEDMTIEQLSDFCILKGIMIDPYAHANLVHTRERIIEAYRVIRQTKKEQTTGQVGKDQKEIDALLEANALPKEQNIVEINLREREVTAASQAKVSPQVTAAHNLSAEQGPGPESDELLPDPEPEIKNGNNDDLT